MATNVPPGTDSATATKLQILAAERDLAVGSLIAIAFALQTSGAIVAGAAAFVAEELELRAVWESDPRPAL